VDFLAVAGYLQWVHWSNHPSRRMKPNDLPLEADRSFVKGAGGVSFDVAIDGECVPCYVSRAALEVYFGADPQVDAGDATASLQAFDLNAELIRRLAGAQWRRRRVENPAVVLTVDAVFRALSGR
jgi:hypothetical protein